KLAALIGGRETANISQHSLSLRRNVGAGTNKISSLSFMSPPSEEWRTDQRSQPQLSWDRRLYLREPPSIRPPNHQWRSPALPAGRNHRETKDCLRVASDTLELRCRSPRSAFAS